MDFQSQSLQKNQTKGCESRDDIAWKNQLKLKRDNGLTFKALINGVSPNHQQLNPNSFQNTKEKVFHSFQSNHFSSQQTGSANKNADLSSQAYIHNQTAVGNSQEVETKALNGFLPMVNSQQLMTQSNMPQQQRPVGLMAARAHLQDPQLGQSGLTFGEYEYKNYPGTQQIQKQLVNQNSDNQVQPLSQMQGVGQNHANSVKIDKQIKLDTKQQSLHFQANQVNGFNSSNRDNCSQNGQVPKKHLSDDKTNNQNQHLGQNSANNKVDKQRRKLLFEYGLEKNFSNPNTTNGSGQFPQNADATQSGLNPKTNSLNTGNLKNMSGQAQIQAQRYGASNSNFGGAIKGSSLGHYQQQAQSGFSSQNHQRTPEGISNNSGHSGIGAANNTAISATVPSSATQQSTSLKSAAQASLKTAEKQIIQNPNTINNMAHELPGMQRRSVIKQDLQAENKFQSHLDQQTSKGNLQQNQMNNYIPSVGSGSQNNHLSNQSQRKQQLQTLMNHKYPNQPGSMGLLEQLLLNLKAINIDKLEEKEQEQLRYLSNQYQFHLNQFQEYQKQQILTGNFDSTNGQNQTTNQQNSSVNSSNKTQSSIRNNNNQSGFSGRLNDLLSVKNQDSQNNGVQSNGSGLGDLQPKQQHNLTEQKHIEGDSMTNPPGHVKQQSASVSNNVMTNFNNVYSSQERFVQNEKNLRDMRLKKSKQRNENTPGQSVTNTEQNQNKAFGSQANNTGALTGGAATQDLSSGSPFFKDTNKDFENSKQSVRQKDGIQHVSSQKNLNRNVSYDKVNEQNTSDTNNQGQKINLPQPPVGIPGPKTSTIGDLPFSFHLNLPHPVPQITSSDIKSLSSNQRVAIFKHLQKREKSKFLGIQQNKMKTQEKQIQIKFTQQRFRNKQLGGPAGQPVSNVFDKGSRDRAGGYLQNESRAAGISVGGSGTGARTGMSRFVSVGQRGQRGHRDQNGRLNNLENDLASQAQFDKQMENLRRQWASDLRAFGIFQQNELWQFSQMNDQQQKQILICNLQQGKFQSLIDEQYEMLMQKYAQQAWLNERNLLLSKANETATQATNRDRQTTINIPNSNITANGSSNSTNPTDTNHQELSMQSKQQRRHTYGSALSQIGKENSEVKESTSNNETNPAGSFPQTKDIVQQSLYSGASNPSKQQSFRNSLNFEKDANGGSEPIPNQFANGDKQDLQKLINSEVANRSISPQKLSHQNTSESKGIRILSKQNNGDEHSKKDLLDGNLHNSDKDKTININFNKIDQKNCLTNNEEHLQTQANNNYTKKQGSGQAAGQFQQSYSPINPLRPIGQQSTHPTPLQKPSAGIELKSQMPGGIADRPYQLTAQNSLTTTVKDRRDNLSNNQMSHNNQQQDQVPNKMDLLQNLTSDKPNDLLGVSQTYNSQGNELKHLLNPVQKRYEDSKDSFQECLRQILCKYQNQINLSHIQGSTMGQAGQSNDIGGNNYFKNDMSALKHRQSESAKNNIGSNGAAAGKQNNLNTISNDKYGYKSKIKGNQDASAGKALNKLKVNGKEDPKKKDSTIVAPNSTKSGAKKIDIDGKEVDADEADDQKEPITEEVKKPRYFPPKRLPNPFESAAQEQERFIQARKEALIKYSNISKNRYKQDEKEPFKYVIRPGNNSKLISRVMEQSGRVEPRYDKNDGDIMTFPGWEPADDYYDSLYHFKWKPTSGGIKYDMISKHGLKQVVNHVRGHGALTTKDNLFLNLKQFYETQKLNIFETVPITIVLDYLKDDIGTKVEQFQTVLNIIEKNITQSTDVINQKLYEMQVQKEKSVKTPYKISPCCHNQQNLWLLKPTGFNRGIGIHLFQNFDQLRDIMCTYYGIGRGARDKSSIFQQHNHNHNPNSQAHPYNDPNNKESDKMKNFTFVIQKLVERPMLYFNRKYDIRQWVLLNSADGKVYIYRESYVRTSSRQYVDYDPQLPEEDQIYMQLTNNAVQKVGSDYEKYEEGNIVSVHTLFEYITGQPEAKGRSKETLETKYKQDIEKMIVETFKSIKGQISQQKYTFELLGYDFIMDQDLNTYLIEVNTNPCLEESNELLRKLLPRMIDDTLNIVLDPVFATCGDANNRNSDKYKSKYPLRAELFSVENNQKGKSNSENLIKETTKHEGYRDDFNLWKHITNIE